MHTDDGEWRIPEAECFVYRIYDRTGALVYVGITNSLLTRLGEHQQGKWWPIGATVRWTEHDTRAAARREEKRLIHSHRPPNNLLDKPRGWHLVLTLDPDLHEPGCLVALAESYRHSAPADRLAGRRRR